MMADKFKNSGGGGGGSKDAYLYILTYKNQNLNHKILCQ